MEKFVPSSVKREANHKVPDFPFPGGDGKVTAGVITLREFEEGSEMFEIEENGGGN
jgi:hypothetical protein